MNESKQAPVRLEAMDILKILEILPHRYPLLLVDRVEDIVLDEGAVGVKNVTFNEPHFMGHFPGQPVMPGVLIIEAMAQTAAVFAILSLGEEMKGKLVYFMAIENAKFRKRVQPGDRLYLHVKKERARGLVWKVNCEAKVDGQLVAEALMTAMIVAG